MDYSNVKVPVSVQFVDGFVTTNTGVFEDTLREFSESITWAVRGERIVKIYGREDRQGGDKFKDVRKIANKFNSYHRGKNNDLGSLWETPDVIGFTVVVSYPSDISSIARIIDGLISQGSFRAEKIRGEYEDDRSRAPIDIDPEYGRVLADRGYFACHYNVRPHSYAGDAVPICEIQIKTAMHDAWGAKTHDLIYKSPAPFDPNILKNFEALGDVLAQIDWQSDLLRDTLSNVSRVRTNKKNSINKYVMEDMFSSAMESLEARGVIDTDGFNLREELSKVSIKTSKNDVRRIESKIMALSDKSAVNYSFANFAPFVAHYFLARNANDRIALRKAEQGLALWIEKINDPFKQTYAVANVALFKFFSDNRLEAIEETEIAVSIFQEISAPTEGSKHFERHWRRGNSINISLAYYFAEIIGTHDGQMSDAKANAEKYLQQSLDARARIASCPNNALVSDEELQACVNPEEVVKSISDGYSHAGATLTNEKLRALADREAESNFQCIDCELFVRTQIAEKVEDIEHIRLKLSALHKIPPASIAPLAVELFQFHDYCIRQRLAELE